MQGSQRPHGAYATANEVWEFMDIEADLAQRRIKMATDTLHSNDVEGSSSRSRLRDYSWTATSHMEEQVDLTEASTD
jgi:hypothetical protein